MVHNRPRRLQVQTMGSLSQGTLVLLLLLKGIVAQQQEVLSTECASDFSYLSRGSQIEGAQPYSYWRTGNPKGSAKATLLAELAPGAVIQSMSFSYRYLAGFGPGGQGGNISVQIGETTIYSSPELDSYNYSVPANHTGYSPAILVTGSDLPFTAPATGLTLNTASGLNPNMYITAPTQALKSAS